MRLGRLPHLHQDTPKPPPALLRLHGIAQLLAVLAIVVISRDINAPLALAAWWASLTASQLLVFSMMASPGCTPDGSKATTDPLLHHYIVAAQALVFGTAWGLLPLALPAEPPPLTQATLFSVLGVVTLAGAGILSHSRSAFAVFGTAALLPLFIQTFTAPPAGQPHVSVMIGLFALATFILNGLCHAARLRGSAARTSASAQVHAQQAMLDSARQALVLTRGGRIYHWNRHFGELMRQPCDGARGASLRRCFADRREWQRHSRAALDAITRGNSYQGVTRLRQPDGREFWAEISARRAFRGDGPLCVVWAASDISHHVDEDERDARHLNQLCALLEQSSDWYWQTDRHHRLMQITPHHPDRSERLARCIGRTWWQFPRSDHAPDPSCEQMRSIFDGQTGFRELRVTIPDGASPPLHLLLNGVPRFDAHGEFAGYHGMALDVTEQVRKTERIHHLAYHDPLTGLPNRRLLSDRLNQAISRARRHRGRVGLIAIDVDDFKRVNEIAGHAAGDQILMEIADRLRHGLRACDSVARLEGDAFVILLPDLEEISHVEQVATKILRMLHEPIPRGFPLTPLGASIGLALFPDDAESCNGLLEIADQRMQRAKRRGGQRIEA